MRRHLSFRSGNPALNKNTFKTFNVDRSRDSLIKNDVMTVEGTVNKTAISLSLLMVAGYYSYTNPQNSLMWLGLGIGIIAFFITFFKKKISSYHNTNLLIKPRTCFRWYILYICPAI